MRLIILLGLAFSWLTGATGAPADSKVTTIGHDEVTAAFAKGNTAVVTGPILTGGCVNLTPSFVSRSCSLCTSSTPKDVQGIPSATSADLNGCAAGC